MRERKGWLHNPSIFPPALFPCDLWHWGWHWEIPIPTISLRIGWLVLGCLDWRLGNKRSDRKNPYEYRSTNDVTFRVENFLMWVPFQSSIPHLQRSSRNPSHININYCGANSSNKSPLGTCRVERLFCLIFTQNWLRHPYHSTWFPTNSTSMACSWHGFFESVWGFQTRIWKSFQSDQPQGVYYPGHTWLMDFQLQDVHFSEQSLSGINASERFCQVVRIWTPSELVSVLIRENILFHKYIGNLKVSICWTMVVQCVYNIVSLYMCVLFSNFCNFGEDLTI